MKCPECGESIHTVNVVVVCVQVAVVRADGQLTDYGTPEALGEIQVIECPKCGKDIKNVVRK